MKSNVLVSIITVCFNSEKTIERTIKSVLNQTYKNIEYIIVDGKSTDATMDIVKMYSEKFNGRLRYISEKDSGIYDAMNKGIRMAQGDIIGIVNSDDYYELDAVEKIIDSMGNEKYQILYGLMRVVNDNVTEKIIMNSHENLKNDMIAHPTCFITKKVYDDFGCYSTNYKSCSDYEFMLRLVDNKDIHFIPVYSVISNFTRGGMSSNIKSRIESLKMKYSMNCISKSNFIKQIIKLRLKSIFKM